MSASSDGGSPAWARVRRGAGVVLALGLSATGCSKQMESAPAPGTAGPGASDAAQEGSADPLAELDALEARMSQLGLPVAGPALGAASSSRDRGALDQSGGEAAGADASLAAETEATADPEGQVEAEAGDPPPAAPNEEADRARFAADPTSVDEGGSCMSVCDLNEMICELEVRICALAGDHEGDPTYVDACRRASEDCDVAGDACDRCAE